ncbi:MAG: cysteine desulfurase [Deltaproteobacteria bacterium]|nr:cysteine desulfurase [Deltaproteobacteria bacterium]
MMDLDHNASTTLDPRVREAMVSALELGNPSSTHARGRKAREALDAARREAAAALGCEPGEVVFTASGSEANALALKGAFLARRSVSARVLISAVEHPSIRESAAQLRPLGAQVVELPVDAQGRVRLEVLERELSQGASVVAVMAANNETGTIQPALEAAQLATKVQVPLLVDAVQAAGKLPMPKLVDAASLLSVSGHKLHGPAGAGLLVVKRGLQLQPLVGGHQERGRRGGTEWVAGAVGLARALTLAKELLEKAREIEAVRDAFERQVQHALPDARVHAKDAPRLGNTSSVLFPGVDGEALLIALDLAGVCASLGAACASGALSPSHVLLAMGVAAGDARSSLRFSFGRDHTLGDVEQVVRLLAEQVPRARR